MFAAVSNRTSSPPKTLLSLDRIFSSNDFADEPVAFRKWRDDGVGYFVLEPLGTETNWSSLVFVDAASGAKECVILGSHLIPPGGSQPIPVHDFQFSPDQTKLLIFTYSQQVWRQNTRGDYWVLDRTDSQLQRLGQSAAPGVLMFAKFAPDSKSVAYIQENNIFIQRLSDLRITAITTNGSASLINGTFDWVNEEELDLRDGFAWSPDGHHIAYWQTDTTGVREHQMIRNTDELYPVTRRWPYPKAGERNSSVRLGVQDIEGGDTRWMDIPGDPREHYLGRMNWTSNSTDLLIQQ